MSQPLLLQFLLNEPKLVQGARVVALRVIMCATIHQRDEHQFRLLSLFSPSQAAYNTYK